jgi:hypothetical protein
MLPQRLHGPPVDALAFFFDSQDFVACAATGIMQEQSCPQDHLLDGGHCGGVLVLAFFQYTLPVCSRVVRGKDRNAKIARFDLGKCFKNRR